MKFLQQSQLFRYVMTGGMTTVINYILFLALTGFSINYLIANSIAWLGAVIFSYFANRQVVFHSKGNRRQEFLKFFLLRLGTLVVENVLLFTFVDFLGIGELPAKIFVSVITVILNYGACKFGIFTERGVSHE